MSRDREKGLRYMKDRPRKRVQSYSSPSTVLYYATSPPLSVTKTTPLSRLLETMVARGFRRVFVATASGLLEGIVTPMEVVKHLLWKSRESPGMPVMDIMSTPVARLMRKDVVSIGLSKNMLESIVLMKKNGVNSLAVVDKSNRLKAVLTVRDVLERFNYSLESGFVEDYMSKSPVCISIDRSLREGVETMVSSGHRRLPCLEKSKPVGLFSSRSIVRFLGGREFFKHAGETLGELMSLSVVGFTVRDLPILDPQARVTEAWEIVKRSSYGSALVVKSGSLEGFLTEMDFLKAVRIGP
ncbi:MAG: CBS domain-containing protein [Candidatus Brockarchaeota archaeon]|nr:CBS domain-containing protein [Candidatus Brockarchaeota archaeon]